MRRPTRRILRRSLAAALLAGTLAGPAAAQDGSPLAEGAELFDQGRYADAVARFQAALQRSPGDPVARLWLGLARMAHGETAEARSAWSDVITHPVWATTAAYLDALHHWRVGEWSSNVNAAVGFCRPNQPRYQECQAVKAGFAAGDPAPPIDRWDDLAGLQEAVRQRAATAAAPTTAPVPSTTTPPAPKAAPAAPARPAPTAPAASRPTGAAAADWPAMGRFQPGDTVVYRTAGVLHERGVVERVGDPADWVTSDSYLLKELDGDVAGWYHYQQVATPEREPFWTGFFVGDWQVSVPMAMNTKVIGNDLYRVVSGGMRLPPLRVSADGTYAWRVMEGSGEKVVRGRWVPREDAPGIVLLKADRGADWTMYNATDKSSLATFGRSQVYLNAQCCTYQTTQRIPTRPVKTARKGERVLAEHNGGWFLMEVVEVGNGRFKLRDPRGVRADEWYPAERVRQPER